MTTIEFRKSDNRKCCDDYRDIESKICDEKFSYIIDFMEFLTDERLKKEDLVLTAQEMMDYALSYATEFKKNREHDLKRVRENN